MKRCALALLAVTVSSCLTAVAQDEDAYYSGEKEFALRPDPAKPRNLGHIGPTGILAHIEQNVVVTIEGTRDGSPAAGKFQAGEVILAVNGKSLKGHNPYIVLGSAITASEAGDGKMVFDLESKAGQQRQVTIQIPVLGAYGNNWPVDCPKSRKIVENAAKFYHQSVKESEGIGIGTALSCLFLLSTGDDAHLPVVKQYFQELINNPKSVGTHTWNNGYNGIACAEYYLRTGDKEVLPVLQAFCDDARDRQNFNSAWKHWGTDINPGYVGGGLMNPASTQVLTTLLLCKEAGVNVDDQTLLNALRYFYRFVGHGTVAYGDHRGEGGIGSNGKDAMLAAAMQIAAGASGNTSIYQSARDFLSLATLQAYPDMIIGHGDEGRGDGIWRGLASYYLMEKNPQYFREVMDKITWWYDLSRYDDGAIGLATCKTFNHPSSGAGAAMTFTAPLKMLRITGAPRSKYAKKFQLPERIWGNEADLAFHSIKPAAGYEKFGEPLPIYRIVSLIGSQYNKGRVASDPDSVSLEQLHKFVRHNNYMIRTQAAKALCLKGEFKTIEELLQDPDPRLRRAALDGMIGWNYFFGSNNKLFIPEENVTPEMIASITVMLTDPKEAAYVAQGALHAMRFMPVAVIRENFQAILPWTKMDDWWFRNAAFTALQGLERDPALYQKVVPILTEIMIAENHTMPRSAMNRHLALALRKFGSNSDIGRLLVKGFNQGVTETQIMEGNRDREGKYNICDAIGQAAQMAPETAPQLATLLVERGLSKLDDDELLQMVSGRRGFDGFLKLSAKLKGSARLSLEDSLYKNYRPEISKRLKAGGGTDIGKIDVILGIMDLRDENIGWQSVGMPGKEDRVWKYLTFDATAEDDMLLKREGRRYREIDLPSNLEGWYKPGFDTSSWQSGQTPIGKGGDPRKGTPINNRSEWGEGEFLLAVTTFELDDAQYDMYRLRILCQQGFDVYLNGKKIRTYGWFASPTNYRNWPIEPRDAALLKKGTNTLAVYTMEFYPSAQNPHWKGKVFGRLDCYIEGLNKKDLY